MSIATRTGDKGKTSLMYGRRVEKFDLRVETYGVMQQVGAPSIKDLKPAMVRRA